MPITHALVSVKPDGPDTDQVQASDWNAAHTGLSGLSSVTIDLTTAQIATLNSVPVEVVAAQGAGTVIVPVAASFQYKAGSERLGNSAILTLLYDGGDILADRLFGTADEVSWVTGDVAGPLFPSRVADDQIVPARLRWNPPARATVENIPLVLVADAAGTLTGSILTSSIAAAGTGHAVNDQITLDEGGVPAVLVVDSVGGGGEVLTYHFINVGTRFVAGDTEAQAGTTGAGIDFVLLVDSITPLSDGTARLTVLYYVMELL